MAVDGLQVEVNFARQSERAKGRSSRVIRALPEDHPGVRGHCAGVREHLVDVVVALVRDHRASRVLGWLHRHGTKEDKMTER
ncbi:MAG TPA: hypothetical protein VLM11_13035 [Streptosporangiaceae bacterium]|nr:hypothetical protein [Streptosporangiaceae bacterium]